MTKKINNQEGKIFLSYSRKDKKLTDWLSRQLSSAGFKIWIDRHDIPGGEEWSNTITDAIINAEAFLLLLSPNAIESQEIKKEIDTAQLNNIRIIPVILIPFNLEWLSIHNLDKLQNIIFYRRRQACIVDIINTLGGLRGVAAIMPNDSTIAIRENAQFIVEMLRIVQEVSFSASILVFEGGEENNYFIQFSGLRDDPEIDAEAVGNKNLNEKIKLDKNAIDTLTELGWQKPNKNTSGNYWQKWKVHTNRDRATVAMITMTTFLRVYKHYPGEYLTLSTIEL